MAAYEDFSSGALLLQGSGIEKYFPVVVGQGELFLWGNGFYSGQNINIIGSGEITLSGQGIESFSAGSAILPNIEWAIAAEEEIGTFLYGRLMHQRNPWACRDAEVFEDNSELFQIQHELRYVRAAEQFTLDNVPLFDFPTVRKIDLTFDVHGNEIVAFTAGLDNTGYARIYNTQTEEFEFLNFGPNITSIFCCSAERRQPGNPASQRIYIMYVRDGQILYRLNTQNNYQDEISTGLSIPPKLNITIEGLGNTDDFRLQARIRVRRQYD